jgi:hypothetical protein
MTAVTRAAAVVVRGPDIHRVHVEAPGPLPVTLTNESPTRSTFVDLHRLETGREGRLVLDPLETKAAELAAGDVELKLGPDARLEIA